jgi:hypothetical protein
MSARTWASVVKTCQPIPEKPKSQTKCYLTSQFLDVIVMILNYTTFENQMSLWFTGDAKWRQLHRLAYESGRCTTFFVFDEHFCQLLLDRYSGPFFGNLLKDFPIKIIDKIPRWFRFHSIEFGYFGVVDSFKNPMVHIIEGLTYCINAKYVINYNNLTADYERNPVVATRRKTYLKNPEPSRSNLDAIIDLVKLSGSTLERVYTSQSYDWMFEIFADPDVFVKLDRFVCYCPQHEDCVCENHCVRMPASSTLLVGLNFAKKMKYKLEINDPLKIKNVEIFPVEDLSFGSVIDISGVCKSIIPLLPNLETIFADVKVCAATVAYLNPTSGVAVINVNGRDLTLERIVVPRKQMVIFKMHTRETDYFAQMVNELMNAKAFRKSLEIITLEDPFGFDMR